MGEERKRIFKLSLFVNTGILAAVLLMWAFFAFGGIKTMSVFSIPTVFIYLINYYFIYKDRLDLFMGLTYAWILIYMFLAVISVGLNFGFHLYCLSLILVLFSSEYMEYKLKRRRHNSVLISFLVVLIYLGCTGYLQINGAIYDNLSANVSLVFWIINSMIVFSFLIGYSYIMIQSVIRSEEALLGMAHKDKLTGLYNRYYTMEYLADCIRSSKEISFLAMLDIDDFKKCNDQYGHDCGDEVLIAVSKIMKQMCPECLISRWGGEEFLIVSRDGGLPDDYLEKLRSEIEKSEIVYGNTRLKVTVTIGGSHYQDDKMIEEWIKRADNNLYYGKNHGKNQVVFTAG